MSDSLRPHGLYSPWNSPGQITGVGICCLLQRIFLTQRSNRGLLHCRRILHQLRYQGSPEVKVKVTQLCPIFCKPVDCSLLCSWNSLGKNTGVGSRSLLQGIFPTQGSNPGLPYCRQILYRLSHQGSKSPAKRCHQLLSLDIRE